MGPGAEIVAASRLYGGSLQQMKNTYPKFGWTANIVDADTPDNFKRAVTDKTKAFFIESLANPGGVISDIEAIARIAEDAGVPLLVDNTLATPWLCKPIDYGADAGRALHHQVPERHRHVDGRRGRRFRQVRLVTRRQVPEPRRPGARLSRPELLRDVRRHGLHLPQPCRRPARPRPHPGAVQRLAHHARHRDARPAHGAPLRQRAGRRAASREASGRGLGELCRPAVEQVQRAGEEVPAEGRRLGLHLRRQGRLRRRREGRRQRRALLAPRQYRRRQEPDHPPRLDHAPPALRGAARRRWRRPGRAAPVDRHRNRLQTSSPIWIRRWKRRRTKT